MSRRRSQRLRRHDLSCNGAGCRDCGTCQIHFRIHRAHTSDEIAVGSRYAALSACQDSHVTAQARTAGRRGNDRACFDKDLEKPFFQCLQVYLLRRRNHDAAHIFGNSAAFQHPGSCSQVGYPSVRTGTDDCLVDLHIADFVDRPGILRQVREGNRRAERAQIHDEFFTAFGAVLKEGIHTDWEHADRIKKLVKYPTARTEAGKRIFLEDYVKDMASGQKDIYYIVAEREEDARRAPQLESARKHGCDVLLFCDPVDEYLSESLREFDGKKFVDVAKGDVAFGTEDEQKAEKDANEKAAKDMKPFLESAKKALEAYVSDVRVSTRLADSPCCLVQQEHALPPSMVRMMRAMKQDVPEEKRILEVNPSHPLVAKVRGLEGDALSDAMTLLYDTALVAEGSPVPDGAKFAKLLASLMMK